MEILVIADRDLSDQQREQIELVVEQAFGADKDDQENQDEDYVWLTNSDWHVVVETDGKIVCHVGVLDKIGTVDGQPLKLGGIGRVSTLPEMQGRGLASATMQRAAKHMREVLKVDFGLLLCARQTAPFYRRVGWQEVPGPLTFDQPQGKETFSDVTMILPCAKQDWPPGTIDLCGLPW